jgi:glycosyltransferase involved in cell wall biosynthesis
MPLPAPNGPNREDQEFDVDQDIPLNICLLSYRSHPRCGGQGVYVRHLSQALSELGHCVEVVSGPPYPELSNGTRLHCLPSLDLYNPEDLFRTPALAELIDPVNLIEWLGVSSMGFPEPLTFGLRARRFLKHNNLRFDVIHDNQSLSYGVLSLARRLPTVATVHHPITLDRKLAIKAERRFLKKAQQWRWYSFTGMQKRVAAALKRLITVSQASRNDIGREFGISTQRISVVPNGIDTGLFRPLPGVERQRGLLVTTTSADTPLKGLSILLRALARLASQRPALRLVVVGSLKKDSPIGPLLAELGLGQRVRFTGPLGNEDYVRLYAQAWAAVIPSLYEGFGLPAGEAMACGVPVISTTAGALPEVVGQAGLLVPPGDAAALALAIKQICDDPDLASRLSRAGYERVNTHFTWAEAARKTVAVYRRTIDDYRRS